VNRLEGQSHPQAMRTRDTGSCSINYLQASVSPAAKKRFANEGEILLPPQCQDPDMAREFRSLD
jgi:hypothetical protein